MENENGTTLRSPQNKVPIELEENLHALERKEAQIERILVPAQDFKKRVLSFGQRI